MNIFDKTRMVVLALIIALGVALSANAQENAPVQSEPSIFSGLHQLGFRLGYWGNRGNLPDSLVFLDGLLYLENDFGDNSFYLEGFLCYRLSRRWLAEFSIGSVSRGDVTLYEDDGGSSIGTVQIFPMLVRMKAYPFGSALGPLHPYVSAGGGIFYGRHSVQIVSGVDAYYRQRYGSDSEVKLGYSVAAGFDRQVASAFALSLSVQYMPIKFGDYLIGVRDYSAVTITFGLQYMLKSLGSNDDKNRYPRRGR